MLFLLCGCLKKSLSLQGKHKDIIIIIIMKEILPTRVAKCSMYVCCAHGISASNNISHIQDGSPIVFFNQFSSINMKIEPITSEVYLYIYI
jgi:hypothetical protein